MGPQPSMRILNEFRLSCDTVVTRSTTSPPRASEPGLDKPRRPAGADSVGLRGVVLGWSSVQMGRCAEPGADGSIPRCSKSAVQPAKATKTARRTSYSCARSGHSTAATICPGATLRIAKKV